MLITICGIVKKFCAIVSVRFGEVLSWFRAIMSVALKECSDGGAQRSSRGRREKLG